MKEQTLRQHAKNLRKKSTEAEKLLWFHLRNNQMGVKFKRQVPLGEYIADFVCLEKRIIIEVDGGQHLESRSYDEKRTSYLNRIGFKVIRFWNHEVLRCPFSVLECIYVHLK